MRIPTAVIVVMLSMTTTAQQWAPIGATWHYPWTINSGPPNPPISGYHLYESLLDTFINGQATRKVDSPFATNDGPFYTHDVEGLIFIYVPSSDSFDTLFNFNAVPGDRWSFVPLPFPLACSDESWVEVVDTGRTVVDGLSLRWLAVDNHNILEDFEYVVPDTIIERLGPKNSFLLPHEHCNTAVSPGLIGGLLCYEDADINYMRPGITDCTLGMGITNRSSPIVLELFPNPGIDGFDLILPIRAQGMTTVYDARGATVLGPLSGISATHVDATTWPTGLYTVRFTPVIGPASAVTWMKW